MSSQVVVVGAGLFGCVITKHLRNQGRDVLLVDARLPGAASPAAGCVLRPTWLHSSLGKELTRSCYQFLDNTYGLHSLQFFVRALGARLTQWQLDWVDPQSILSESSTQGRVIRVGNGVVSIRKNATTEHHEGTIVVAAGHWVPELLPAVKVKANWGVALRFPRKGFQSQLVMINPFRQAVAFQIAPNSVWFGDGTKLKGVGDSPQKVLDNAVHMFGLSGGNPQVLIGARPTMESNTGILKQLDSRLWVATGGGKIGLALAAHFAQQLGERL